MAVRDTRKHERRPKVRRLAPAVIGLWAWLCAGLRPVLPLPEPRRRSFSATAITTTMATTAVTASSGAISSRARIFGFPFGDRFIRPAPPPADYSKAPPPRKLDNPPATSIVVIGDLFADWLAYGLDETYSDQPDMGVVRKVKATSGLIRYDPKNEALDWPGALKDALAGEKPNAIVVMLGFNDRIPLKASSSRAPPKPVPAKPANAGARPGRAASAGSSSRSGRGAKSAGAKSAAGAKSGAGAAQAPRRRQRRCCKARRPRPSRRTPRARAAAKRAATGRDRRHVRFPHR